MRDIEHEFAGVLGAAHHPDGGGGVGKRVVRALRHRQRAVRGELVHRAQQVSEPVRMAERHQRQVDGVEREVAPEREEPQPGVAVDVAFADLDESSTERQQFEPGALGGAGDRVEHDVDAVPVGVTADLVGELGAARVVDMLNTHVAQQLSTLLAARGGEDLGSRGAGDRDRRLPHAAGRGVDQHLSPALIRARSCRPYQAVACRGGHRGRLRRRSGRPAA